MTTDSSETPMPGARYALVMLTIAYTFNFIDRQILVILQPSIKKDMALTDAQLGLLSGFSFALVYITAGIPIAYWADRGNRRNIVALAVAVWSGMTALSGLAQNYLHLLLARIGVGIGEAGGSPPAHAMISDFFPPKARATALSIYSTGVHIGVLVGFLLGGFLDQILGWRAAFMAVGVPGVIFATVFFFTVKEPQRGRWESGSEATYKPSLSETFQVLAGYRSFWYLAAGAGLTAFAGYGNGNFTPSFLVRSHGLEVGTVGVLLAVFAGGVALPLSFPYLLLDQTWIVIPLLFAVSVLINTYLGPCLAISHSLVPPAMRALASAILFFVLNLIGLGMGPLTAGLLSDVFTESFGADGLRYAMIVVAMIASLGVLMFFLAARSLPEDLERSRARAEANG